MSPFFPIRYIEGDIDDQLDLNQKNIIVITHPFTYICFKEKFNVAWEISNHKRDMANQNSSLSYYHDQFCIK